MKITVRCDGCGKDYEVDGAYAGKRGKCATCGQLMMIPQPEAYSLEGGQDSQEPTAFTPPRAGSELETSQARDRSKKKKSRRPGRRVGESPSPRSAWSRFAPFFVLMFVAAIVAIVGVVMPPARTSAGRLIALAGLVVFLYGYGSGAFIAFSEDDLYGWLYVIFPPYAAYYFVSRWDDMQSRLVMMFVGLALLAGGGRLLEKQKAPAEGAGAVSRSVRHRRSMSSLRYHEMKRLECAQINSWTG